MPSYSLSAGASDCAGLYIYNTMQIVTSCALERQRFSVALSKLDSLYKAVVTDHSAHPIIMVAGSAEQVVLNNPTCGDVINLSVKFNTSNQIEDIAFVNSGCTISNDFGSMMTDAVLGKTKEQALELAEGFLAYGSGPGRQS